MVELNKKYQIGARRFNINWIGAYTLYAKETLRFLSVFSQTILGPIWNVLSIIITTILMSVVWGVIF